MKKPCNRHITDIKQVQMIYIYILKLSDNTHYCGITNNIQRRIKEHNDGHSKSTKYKRPITLEYLRTAPDRKAARVIEIKIKKIGPSRFMRMKSTCKELGQLPH